MTTPKNPRNDDNNRFLKVPHGFWCEEHYSKLTPDEILLYALMRDRMGLSKMNNWLDKTGQVYIYFTIDEIRKYLRCGKEKAIKTKKNLKDAGLIAYSKGRRGDPDRIHVLPLFITNPKSCYERSVSDTPNHEGTETKPDRYLLSDSNKTECNKTENNNNNLSGKDRCKNVHEAVRAIIKENIDYDILSERGYDMDTINNYIEIMVSASCSRSDSVKIGDELVPKSMVCSRFEKYTSDDILYVMDSMSRNTSDIKNIHAYMLRTLYNAPVTRTMSVDARVRHDMPELAMPFSIGGGKY